MFFKPLSLYTQQFKNQLDKYEETIQKKQNLTDEYIAQKKEQLKDIEEKINHDFNLIRYMNYSDLYLNTINMRLPQLYLEVYLLWLEKMKEVYELDTSYFIDLVKLSYPILQNPLLKNYNIFDVYKHFNFLLPPED